MTEGSRIVPVGMTGFPTREADTEAPSPELAEHELLQRAEGLLRGRRLVVLTGAGLSTDSGIPDYRGPNAVPRKPMTFQEFSRDVSQRQRYWARNHVGWHYLRQAVPNPGHYALASFEEKRLLTGLITQNVDRLHETAGSVNVVDLHGRFDTVVCLSCGTRIPRSVLAGLLEDLNPGYAESVGSAGDVAPDADADVEETLNFTVADCPVCGGMLKPDFVYFGESVPKDRVARAFRMVDDADALLVAGSSLSVMSGLRFVRRMTKNGGPVVIINRGWTRGDDHATLKIEMGTSTALTHLAQALPAL